MGLSRLDDPSLWTDHCHRRLLPNSVLGPVQKSPSSSSLKYNGVRPSFATAHWNPQKFKVRITYAGPEAPGPRGVLKSLIAKGTSPVAATVWASW